jgi:hypothetical protein
MTKPTFSGEVQFAGYSDSSRSGPRVTLRLSDRSDLERFVGCEGKRYMVALVEIGSDEQPVSAPEPEKPKGGPLAKSAGIICGTPMFQKFAGVRGYDVSEGGAAQLVRDVCNVTSRAELDGSQAKQYVYSGLMAMYRAWAAEQGATA